MIKLIAYSLSAVALCGGCSVERYRWSSVNGLSDVPAQPVVSVYFAPADLPPSTQIPDTVRVEVIKALAAKSKTPAALKANYNAFFQENDSSRTRDETVMERTLVIGLAKRGIRPGDRIDTATITIDPVDFSFAGYTVAATQYNTTLVESVDSKNDITVSGQADAGQTGVATGEVKGTVEHSREVKSDVNDVAPKPYVYITPCRLILTEGSRPNQDITGTTIIKLTLIANSFTSAHAEPNDPNTACRGTPTSNSYHLIATSQELFKNGQPIAPLNASINAVNIAYKRGSLRAKVRLDYVYRFIKSGMSTPIEDDDTANYFNGTIFAASNGEVSQTESTISIVDGGGSTRAIWAVCIGGGGLNADLGNGQRGTLLFDDLASATEMSKWLSLTNSFKVGNVVLTAVGQTSLRSARPCPQTN